jgi:hypothetical protein
MPEPLPQALKDARAAPGSSYEGDCARLLRDMADVYERRFGCLAAG